MKSKVLFTVLLLLMVSICPLMAGGRGESGGSASQSGVVEMTMWYQENASMIPGMRQRVEDFNEAYKGQYHLSIEFIPRGSSFAYEDKVNSAAFTNQLPDLLSLDGPNLSNYAANGLIIPIDEYVTAESKSDMMPSIVLQDTYDGKMYAIGINESSTGLFYNKDVFAKNGFRIPKDINDAYTWEELYQMAKKVSTPEMVGIKWLADKGEGVSYYLGPFWVSNDASFTSADGSTCEGYINSPKSVETAKYFQRFYMEKLANIDPSPTEFQDGKSAMFLANSGQIAGFLKNYPDFNWGVTYTPISPAGKSGSGCGSWTLGISKDTKNAAAAAVALNFMTNAESTLVYSDAGGYPPARKSSFVNNKQWTSEPYKVFGEHLFANAAPRPRTPVYTVLSPKFSETMLDIFRGTDAKTALDALAKHVDAEYNRFMASIKR